MDVAKLAEQFNDLMYQASHSKLTEKQLNYLLDLLDRQQKSFTPMSTGWVVIEAFKDYVKDRV